MNQTPPYIVCAAMRQDGFVVTGARHFDVIMRATILALNKSTKGWEQGFIDQFGKFYTRKEAWKVADKNGQIRRGTGFESFSNPRKAGIGDDGVLFSENLY